MTLQRSSFAARNGAWGCGALIVVLALLANAVMPGGYLTLFLYILSLPAAFMLVVSIATYIYALLSLSKSVTLSLYHANEHNDRIRRRMQRLREQEEREERLRRQATAPAQPDHRDRFAPHRTRRRLGHLHLGALPIFGAHAESVRSQSSRSCRKSR
jgi:hypothetical protein